MLTLKHYGHDVCVAKLAKGKLLVHEAADSKAVVIVI